MPSRKTEQLTTFELEIMNVLWETGPANVQAVQKKLARQSAYTTVQTMLNVLHRKGKVTRKMKDKAYYYRPAVSRRQVARQAIGEIVERLFGGSAESLVMSLLETRHLTPEKLSRLNELLDKSDEADGGKD